MADWRQIQARIRKARNSADPVSALTEIYNRTRDAMAAYELGRALEKAERSTEAVEWYSAAAERFRRADWKRKALDALTRLGAPIPLAGSEPQSSPAAGQTSLFTEGAPAGRSESEFEAETEDQAEAPDTISADEAAEPRVAADLQIGAGSAAAPKKRRRGRRGGRGRRRGRDKSVAAQPQQPAAVARTPDTVRETPAPARAEEPRRDRYAAPTRPSRGEARGESRAASRFTEPEPVAPTVGSSFAAMRGRAGDPGMASRLAQLESQLRRLLGATPHSMDDVDSAPAGPGVFVLSESDQTTYYYVEACRTLRIAISQIAKARGTGGVRAQLAEHLGISESKVSKYLKDHCVVRWLQLDEDSSHLAHFTIAVLRPALNE